MVDPTLLGPNTNTPTTAQQRTRISAVHHSTSISRSRTNEVVDSEDEVLAPGDFLRLGNADPSVRRQPDMTHHDSLSPRYDSNVHIGSHGHHDFHAHANDHTHDQTQKTQSNRKDEEDEDEGGNDDAGNDNGENYNGENDEESDGDEDHGRNFARDPMLGKSATFYLPSSTDTFQNWALINPPPKTIVLLWPLSGHHLVNMRE